jgi:hypothetical protein
VTEELINQQAQIVSDEIDASLNSIGAIKVGTYRKAIECAIFGKTLDQWHDQLSVKIDPGADPARVKYYCSQLAMHIDTAYRNLAKAKQAYAKYKLSYLPNLNAGISKQATHKGRKVAPAMETMLKVVENDLGDRSLVITEYEALVDFWLDMVFKLQRQTDLVKTISIANGTLNKVGEY